MKLKGKSNLLLLILPILFITLHHVVYLNDYRSSSDGWIYFPDWFILVSVASEPLSIEKIALSEFSYPDYFHPFNNFEYHYIEKSGNETVIIERGSMFSSDMKNITGDPANYYDKNTDGIFYRGSGSEQYPNKLFYLVQYIAIVAFVLLIVRKIIKLKK